MEIYLFQRCWLNVYQHEAVLIWTLYLHVFSRKTVRSVPPAEFEPVPPRFSVKKEPKAGLRRFGYTGLTVFALSFPVCCERAGPESLSIRKKHLWSSGGSQRLSLNEKKKQLGTQSACANHASDLFRDKEWVFWCGACVVVLLVLFLCSCDQSCVYFSCSSRSHIILVFAHCKTA